jgi:hypothetical protein
VDWLMDEDPGRLVVDNSACETGGRPGFHLRTDVADFHAYRSMPDGLPRWQALLDDLASHPAWLWSPHGDASPSGDEAIVLSEFGNWGLPRPPANPGEEPWWWQTGGADGPAGTHQRFRDQGLDRIWPDLAALAEATQWRQREALAAQIRELRRRPDIAGYVVTELTDVAWEANGLLDFGRRPKVFHDRIRALNAADILVVDPPIRELWGGEPIRLTVTVASMPDGETSHGADHGRLAWSLLSDGVRIEGSETLPAWPGAGLTELETMDIALPDVGTAVRGQLHVTAGPIADPERASYREDVIICPAAARRSDAPRRVRVVDPLGQWSIALRLAALGHDIVDAGPCDLIVVARLDDAVLDEVERGASLLLLARSDDAIAVQSRLAVPVSVRRRRPGQDATAEERAWEGDWISVFAWAAPGAVPGLPEGGLLGDPYAEIFPGHVLTGIDAADPAVRVDAGMFAGWLRHPAALLATFRQGAGRVVMTTLHACPEDGPVATSLLEQLVQRAGPSRSASGPPPVAVRGT